MHGGPPRWFRNLPPTEPDKGDAGCFTAIGCIGFVFLLAFAGINLGTFGAVVVIICLLVIFGIFLNTK